MFKRGSKDKEKFDIWQTKVNQIISTAKIHINELQDLNDLSDDNLSLEDYLNLETKFKDINVNELVDNDFSLKGKDKDLENDLKQELEVFIDDVKFFRKEINNKISYYRKILHIHGLLDDINRKITEFEPKQQQLAKSIPRLNNSGELELAEKELDELFTLIPKTIDQDPDYSDEILAKIQRTETILISWYKKLAFIESSLQKYKGKVQKSLNQQEHKDKLAKIHSWIDSSSSKIKKIKEKLKNISDQIQDDSTPSKELINLEKSLIKLLNELKEIISPNIDISGEEQTKIGIKSKIIEINDIEKQINTLMDMIQTKISYRLAYIRTRILEKMFTKSHQLSYTKVNYSLGLRNELLFKGWLQNFEDEDVILKNHLNKYLIITNTSITNYQETSKKLFNLIKEFSEFERKNSESYRASIKWLSLNDSKWLDQ